MMWGKYTPDTLVVQANKKGKPTVTLMGQPEKSASKQAPPPNVDVPEIINKINVRVLIFLTDERKELSFDAAKNEHEILSLIGILKRQTADVYKNRELIQSLLRCLVAPKAETIILTLLSQCKNNNFFCVNEKWPRASAWTQVFLTWFKLFLELLIANKKKD
jgi:hypothetical protein